MDAFKGNSGARYYLSGGSAAGDECGIVGVPQCDGSWYHGDDRYISA